MKICKHVLSYGLDNIPAAGGDWCPYCIEEDMDRFGCKREDCSVDGDHYHPEDVDRILQMPTQGK